MGEWQRDPTALKGESGVAYLVAMTEDCNKQAAVASKLSNWATELDFKAVLMTDPSRQVYRGYAKANNCEEGGAPGGPGCSNSVTVVIDKKMRIRYFGRTYLCGTGERSQCGDPATISAATVKCLSGALTEIKTLLAE